jgi:fumarate reductase flavoprotein subunit
MQGGGTTSIGDFDVIVVGAGMAGYAAAISASREGASVLLLEKMKEPGGGTAWSGGAFSFAGTEEQRDAGIDDSEQLLREDLTRGGRENVRSDLVELYISRQHETYLWLKSLGVPFSAPVLSPGQSVPRSHATSARELLKLLHARFLELPKCSYLPEAAVVRVMRDGASGRKLQVSRDGAIHDVTARRAVVLATGGFSRSADIIKRFAPWLEKAKRMGGEGATGDGFKFGVSLGGDFADFGWLEGTFGAILPNYPSPQAWIDNDTILMHAVYSGAIILNKEGRRFVDESLSYRKLGRACLEQPGAVAFQLFDTNVMEASRTEPVTRNFRNAFERGLIQKADSIRGAAELMGLPAEAVEHEVATYNQGIREGVEPTFGRGSLLNGQGKPVVLQTPPFYIYPCTTAIVATYAGLIANSRMALLDVYGDEVPGVFVAGEIVGGFHGPAPMSGTSICKAAIFGLTAGKNAAHSPSS